MIRRRHLPTALLTVALVASGGAGQSLRERLDEEAFLQGLVDAGMADVLEHVLTTEPPANAVLADRFEIELLRLTLPDLDDAERPAQLNRIFTQRAGLIDGYPAHPDRGIWLADQASDLWFESITPGGSILTTVFGRLPRTQRTRLVAATEQMSVAAAAAERAIDQTILDLESRPGYRTDETLQLKRRRLARDEGMRRVPFLRGAAAFMQAFLARDDTQRHRHLQLAADVLEPLPDDLAGELGQRAALFATLARIGVGDTGDAETRLEAIIANPDTHPSDVFAARLGQVQLARASGGGRAGDDRLRPLESRYSGPEHLFHRLILVDQRSVTAEPARRFDPYLAFLERETGVDPDALRQLIFERLADAAEDDTPLESLPAIVTVARAERVRTDERRRGEAIALYQTALGRAGVSAPVRSAALIGLGRALHAAGRPAAAVRSWLELATNDPRHREAERWLEAAATLAWRQHRSRPEDPEAAALLQQTLDQLLARTPPVASVDRWRLLAGRLAATQGDPEAALTHLRAIDPAAEVALDARFAAVGALRAHANDPDAPPGTTRFTELGREAAQTRAAMQAAAATASPRRAGDLRFYATELQVIEAEALLGAGEPIRALEAIAGIEQTPGLEPTVLASALRVRIRASQAADRPEEARRAVGQFLETAPEQAGVVLDAMLARLLDEQRRELDQGTPTDEVTTRFGPEIAPLATALDEWLRSADLDASRRAAYQHRAAEGHLASGQTKAALRLYDRLARTNPHAAEVLLGRAECLYRLGADHLAEAIVLYKRLAAGGLDLGHHFYWQANLRILQILDLVGRNTHKIVPQINRLRAQDPTLGGVRYAVEFERLERKRG
ncbi:MAG: hypothetical protein HKN62_11950 [Phycisphaerales bacterium]|nr:hypothetical protein [Phycisphaerales bacterium]